jgi:hypothetical protein
VWQVFRWFGNALERFPGKGGRGEIGKGPLVRRLDNASEINTTKQRVLQHLLDSVQHTIEQREIGVCHAAEGQRDGFGKGLEACRGLMGHLRLLGRFDAIGVTCTHDADDWMAGEAAAGTGSK